MGSHSVLFTNYQLPSTEVHDVQCACVGARKKLLLFNYYWYYYTTEFHPRFYIMLTHLLLSILLYILYNDLPQYFVSFVCYQ